MKTRVFAYNGILAAETDMIKGKFLNNPLGDGQLGCVIDSKEVEITKDAKEIMKSLPKTGGSFAAIMLTKHDDGGSSLGLMGGGKHLFTGEDRAIGRTCDHSVIDDFTEVSDDIIPDDFKKYVDEEMNI